VVAFVDITTRKLSDAALASVSGKLIEAQEQERRRIARELHDDIGQRLALLGIELAQLQQSSSNPSAFAGHIVKLQKQTSEIAADVQSLSHELHSSKLQYLGLAAALKGFCQEFSEQQKVEVDFKTHDLPTPLPPPDISLCFFRVLQEALHNAAKHSGVRHFEVRLWGTQDEMHLTISDSGVGFDVEATEASRGLGLISMHERLKLLNGTLAIKSQLQSGTTLHASVLHRSNSESM
jgi:signal transduction histidine kinase